MKIDFTPYFKQYEEVLTLAGQIFEKVRNEYPELVKCKLNCSDCCYALFDLTLIEAIYINHKFRETYSGEEQERLLEKANKIDRATYKLKRQAYKDLQNGVDEQEILDRMAAEKMPCPLLNDEDLCDLYRFRPVTCRLYGIPLAIGGAGRTCGLSGFEKGGHYPTVNLEIIQNKLYAISRQLVQDIESRYNGLADMLVPLSMALLTDYNEEYLGIGTADTKGDPKPEPPEGAQRG